MRKIMPTILACSLVASAAAGAGGPQPDVNADAERGFYRMAFTEGKGDEAYRRYGDPHFIQHNPTMADGVEARIAYLHRREHEGAGEPSQLAWANIVQHVVIDHDILLVQHHVFRSPADPGRMFVDIWRFKDGRIAEHWDIIQDVPAKAVNPMWCGSYAGYDEARTLGDTSEHPTCGKPDAGAHTAASVKVVADYVALLQADRGREAAERYLTPDYHQYSPFIAAGKAGAIARMATEFDPHRIKGSQVLLRVVAQNDLVVHHQHVTRPGGDETVQADIFQVRNGRIAAHWDVKQIVRYDTASGHPMW